MNIQKTIYIADDESNIRQAIKTFLENAGYIVEDFENGDLLLEAFRNSAADLVILDVMMPGSNGFTICKELRKISHIPIIMLTARDSDLDYMTGLDLGSDDYLTKPFSPMALVMRVKAIFRRMEYDRMVYAEQDPMTGLYNKASGAYHIENELNTSSEKSTHAMFIIDIDDFKSVNDMLGHAAGDDVILAIAETLPGLFRDADIVYRFGGDEFIVFAKNITNMDFINKKAGEVCNALRRKYGSGKDSQIITVSVGVASFPLHGLTYDDLFQKADAALYKAKASGKDRFSVYAENNA